MIRRESLALTVVVGAAVFSASWLRAQQGLDLGGDGLWMLSAQTLQDGGTIYRDIELADGPARHGILAIFFSIFGSSAATLALLKGAATALSAMLCLGLIRNDANRTQAGILAIGTLMLFVAAAAAPLWTIPLLSTALLAERGRPRAMASAWFLSSLFGAGALAGATIIAAPVLLGSGRPRDRQRMVRAILVAIAATLAVYVGLGLARGSLAPLLEGAFVQPASSFAASLRSHLGVAWWGSFRGGPFLSQPFAGLNSGEALAAVMPAHDFVRALSLRLLYIAILLGPIVALWRRQRVAFGLCLAAALLLAGRGDIPRLLEACLLSAPGWALAVATLRPSARARWAWAAISFCALAPLAIEGAWLLSHHYRPTLQLWDQPRANILLHPSRIRSLEQSVRGLERGENSHTLFWNRLAGLHYLFELPAATQFAGAAPRSDVDRRTADAEFIQNEPKMVFLTPELFRGATPLRSAQPEIFKQLRSHYTLLGSAVGGSDEFRALAWREAEAPLPSLSERLPAVEMTVSNDVGPAMQPGLSIGQTLIMGDEDLAGLSVRWNTSTTETLVVPLRLRIWMRRGEDYDVLLQFFDTEVSVPRDGHRSYLRFGPVAATAGLDLAISLELREEIDADLRLLWHRHDGPGDPADFYREGTAVINQSPVAADLYFAIY